MKEELGIKEITFSILLSIFTGISVAISYMIFEYIANEGTSWLWNDLLSSDTYRWRVIPIAIVLGVIYSAIHFPFKQERIHTIQIELLDDNTFKKIEKKSVKELVGIFLIGAISLLAGASLGPEASLLMLSIGIAAWITGKLNKENSPLAQMLSLSALTALLTSFFFSFVPLLIPVVMLYKKKKLTIFSFLIVAMASISAWLVIHFLKGEAFGTIPISETIDLENILIALVLGVLTVPVGIIIKRVIYVVGDVASWFDKRLHWIITAMIFGLVIGLLYFIGGETVQFSGSDGVHLLHDNLGAYTALGLALIFLVKILVTSWSLGTGYRGGLVFPTVFIGVSLAYTISMVFSLTGAYESGATIGSVSGVFISMINPFVGSVLLFSLFPLSVIPLAAAGVVGALIGDKLLNRFQVE